MSTDNRTVIRRKFYLDSVALMRSSKTLAALPGVIEAAMMMGTPANTEIMQNAGLLVADQISDESITAADLVISIRASNAEAADAALLQANELLDSGTSAADAQQWRPRSIRSAIAAKPETNLALISVPGEFAVSEARKAIRRGVHAMIFSDNVPLEQEVSLKQEATALNKLVMGPDCGTAIINGVPLAFANKVPRGPIGIVGASGTGMQEVSCLLAQQGVGISQAIGVGGRDLKDAVGGLMSVMALKMLINDSDTQHIVLISKPASDDIIKKLLALLATTQKTATLCVLGGNNEIDIPDNCQWASTLQDAADSAIRTLDPAIAVSTSSETGFSLKKQPGKLLRGLFCGGTLCAEAQVLLTQAGIACSSNVPLEGSPSNDPTAHTLIDLGDDEYTRGKPHPMIDPSSRDIPVMDALQDDRVGVLLVDMVIGYGAHTDPAGQFVNSLQQLESSETVIVASVTGTEDDPQCLSTQRATLMAAGVCVANSNAEAVSIALDVVANEA